MKSLLILALNFSILSLLFSCAAKDEDVVGLAGTYKTATSKSVVCIPNGDLSSDQTQWEFWDQVSGYQVTLIVSGRTLRFQGGNSTTSCVAEGQYEITTRSGTSEGKLDYFFESTDISDISDSCVVKIDTSGTPSGTQRNLKMRPDATLYNGNYFQITSSGILLQIPMIFDVATSHTSSTCQNGDYECPCFLTLEPSS